MNPTSRSSPSTPNEPGTAALTRSARLRKQAGFLLLEATVVLGLIALAAVSYMALQMMQTRIDKGKVVGEKYARINASLGRYMSVHSVAIKGLHPDCSLHGLASITSKTKLVGTTCNLIINGTPVVNGLQPTVEELVSLGLLRKGTTDALDLPSKTVIAAPKADGSVGNIAPGTSPNDADYSPAPAKLLAVITQHCVPAANALSGRYVLIRRPNAGEDLALDEVEVISNGSNVASSAVLTSSTVFSDGRGNSAAYYGTSNLVDLKLTNAPPTAPNTYSTPGLFRSEVSVGNRAWVQLDLGWQRDISNIGLRSAQGANGTGTTTTANWQTEGASLLVEIGNTAVNTATGLIPTPSEATAAAAAVRTADLSGLLPSIMKYYSNANFSAAPNTVSVPTAQGCPPSSSMALSSLLFNTQPYVLPSWQGSGAMLAMVLQHAGTEAAMSDPAGGGELKNAGLIIDNPLRYYEPEPSSAGATDTGVGGIIAVRNGYDSTSASADGQTNPGGSALPTEAWDLNNQSLTNVANITTSAANVLGNIAAQGTITGSTGSFTNLTATTGNFTNVNIATSALVRDVSATAGVTAQDVSATRGSFNELKLPVAVAGVACTSATQSIAQDSNGKFLACSANAWTAVTSSERFDPRSYYKVQITMYKPTATEPTGGVSTREQFCTTTDSTCSENIGTSKIIILTTSTSNTGPTAFPTYPTYITTTKLKTSQWLPTVMSSEVRQDRAGDILESYFNVNEQATTLNWQIGVRVPKADAELILRFYKINQ